MSKYKQWRGLKDMLVDAVEQGASAIERVHLETARRSFTAVKQVPSITEPTEAVHNVHDTVVSSAYAGVRAVTRAVGQALDVAIDTLESAPRSDEERAAAEASHDPKPDDGTHGA